MRCLKKEKIKKLQTKSEKLIIFETGNRLKIKLIISFKTRIDTKIEKIMP